MEEPQRVSGGQVLITGGSGVIGGYIIESLEKEFDIVVADLIKPQSDLVKFAKIDLTKPFSVSRDFEVCIHLAAYVGGIQYFTTHPVENLRYNPIMTINALDAAKNSNVKHMIYTSSSIVYEHQSQFPTKEYSANSSPPPRSAYGMSKLFGEYLCKAYKEQFGIIYTILRPFNVYGPREAPDPEYAHVIPHLTKKVFSGQYPVEIYGSGKQTRTFTHGKDAGYAYLLTITNKNSYNEIFNVAGDEEISIINLLEMIWTMTGYKKKLKVKNLPPFPHDVKRRFPSIKKIYDKIKWKPRISLKSGLPETIEWIRDNYV